MSGKFKSGGFPAIPTPLSVVPKIFASLEMSSGYNVSNRVTGSNGVLTGSGGTYDVYCSEGISAINPVGTLRIDTAGYYSVSAGGCIRSGNQGSWIARMGFRIGSGVIHATKVSQPANQNEFIFTMENVIVELPINTLISLAYNCDYVNWGSQSFDFTEGFLTITKVD
jgi:hypothetical protein